MPRQSRIDAHGALHYIIAGGIERKRIFDDFLNRLGNILTQTQTACFSWALINYIEENPYEIKKFSCAG